jgi:hypothetical protein
MSFSSSPLRVIAETADEDSGDYNHLTQIAHTAMAGPDDHVTHVMAQVEVRQLPRQERSELGRIIALLNTMA